MILILSNPLDLHASHVAPLLRERGAEVIVFDPARFPQTAEISIAYSPAGVQRQMLRVDGNDIDLRRVRAVWYRRPERPIAHDAVPDATARAFVEQECLRVLSDLWSSLDCAWLPGPPVQLRHADQKALQLKVAGELGFELPPTLVTNCPANLIDFYRQHDGRIVSKQAGKAWFDTVGHSLIRYTELVTTRDIAHAKAIAYCPMIFQAYVDKRVELRITVVDEQVFACEIHSQRTHHTRHDWRRYDHGQTPHLRHQLPRDVEARCVELVASLGLRYGAIDMIVTPDERYVFVEINPNGQYLWIEYETGLPITDAICDVLTGAAPARVATGTTNEPRYATGDLR